MARINADTSKTLKNMNDQELESVVNRLRGEERALEIIRNIKRMTTPFNPIEGWETRDAKINENISTEVPVVDMYHKEDDKNFLQHFGIKGMKWGIRKDRKGKKLSNAEISKRIKRMQLENQYSSLTKGNYTRIASWVGKIVVSSATAVATQQLIKRGNVIVDGALKRYRLK